MKVEDSRRPIDRDGSAERITSKGMGREEGAGDKHGSRRERCGERKRATELLSMCLEMPKGSLDFATPSHPPLDT